MSKSIAIIGGGIIGTCTAYYLSRHPKIGSTTIHLFEGTAIAAAASGRAGGFLASNWQGHATGPLAEMSFKLHAELAEEYDGAKAWSYRRLTTLSVQVSSIARDERADGVEWLNSVSESREIGSHATTAQITPGDFCERLIQAAQEKGVQVSIATVTEMHELEDGWKEIIAETSDGERISYKATDVIFAAGPWTGRLATKFLGEKAGIAASIEPSNGTTSIILRPKQPLSPHALFTSVEMPDGVSGEPEVYPRPNGTVYIAGGGSSTPLSVTPFPDKASGVRHSPILVDKLWRYAEFISPSHLSREQTSLELAQACHRPDSKKTGTPIIGEFGKGLWIASGHQVWGINNGPGTGKVLAELMLDGKATSCDISALLPK